MKWAVVGVWALALALVSGCLISPVIPIGGGKSSTEIQHEGLGKLFPAQLTAPNKWTGEVRVAKLRVWADDEYRAQNVRWQHGFEEQLDYANQVLTRDRLLDLARNREAGPFDRTIDVQVGRLRRRLRDDPQTRR